MPIQSRRSPPFARPKPNFVIDLQRARKMLAAACSGIHDSVAAPAEFETKIGELCFFLARRLARNGDNRMRPPLGLPIVLALSCLPAKAQENLPPKAQEKIEIGQGVICDTLQQVERYIALRGNGAETNVALQAVNGEAYVPVCRVALVMFSAGARVAGLSVQGRLLSIIQINVHAFGNGPVWRNIPATIRYTVTAEKGQIV